MTSFSLTPEQLERLGAIVADIVAERLAIATPATAAARLATEDVVAIAELVTHELRGTYDKGPSANNGHADSSPLVDAAELARQLGLSRATVYANADRLGAVRLGDGEKARLRFDPEAAKAALRAAAPPPAVAPPPRPRKAKPRKRVLQARPRSRT
jgi:hypothetical protein